MAKENGKDSAEEIVIKYLKKNKINQVSLISYSDYNLKTTYKPELLNNFFDNKLDTQRQEMIAGHYEKTKYLYLTGNSVF